MAKRRNCKWCERFRKRNRKLQEQSIRLKELVDNLLANNKKLHELIIELQKQK